MEQQADYVTDPVDLRGDRKNYCLRPSCSWQCDSWHSKRRFKGISMPHKLQANKEAIFREALMNENEIQ
jgi:hypothetical protein